MGGTPSLQLKASEETSEKNTITAAQGIRRDKWEGHHHWSSRHQKRQVRGKPSLELKASEETRGRETITGAQGIRGLCRIYPSNRSARDKLLGIVETGLLLFFEISYSKEKSVERNKNTRKYTAITLTLH